MSLPWPESSSGGSAVHVSGGTGWLVQVERLVS
jgi:hypothetical protein